MEPREASFGQLLAECRDLAAQGAPIRLIEAGAGWARDMWPRERSQRPSAAGEEMARQSAPNGRLAEPLFILDYFASQTGGPQLLAQDADFESNESQGALWILFAHYRNCGLGRPILATEGGRRKIQYRRPPAQVPAAFINVSSPPEAAAAAKLRANLAHVSPSWHLGADWAHLLPDRAVSGRALT